MAKADVTPEVGEPTQEVPEPCESGEALELDEAASDRALDKFWLDNPNYEPSDEYVAHLRGAKARYEQRKASRPPREELLRRAEALFAKIEARRR